MAINRLSKKDYQNILIVLLLAIIVIGGLYFRLKGIMSNHSFWADEAYVSSYSRDIVNDKNKLITSVLIQDYQPLQVLITYASFMIFGVSEKAARLPSVFFGTLVIILAYMLAKHLSDRNGGLLAAFLFAFSQLNLANSTQAKPYAALSMLLLALIYMLVKKQSTGYWTILILVITPFVHSLAITFWIIYMFYMILFHKHNIIGLIKKPFVLGAIIIIFLLTINVLKVNSIIINFFSLNNNKFIFWFDNTMYLKNLLLKQYGIFVFPALLSLFVIYKKRKELVISLSVWIIVILFLWNFRQYSHNIRYLVPFFGIVFVFFGVFWAEVGKYLLHKKSWIVIFIVGMILFISGYKVVKMPSYYYSPNADLYGDVQTADYKTLYQTVKKKFPDYKNMAIFNDIYDAHRWYMPEKTITALFMKGFGDMKPVRHGAAGIMIYKNLEQFISEKNKYSKGILIVEDWDSFLPEDIKQYAKKNMKKEITVKSLKVAENDPWPLEVYSWGI